MLYSFYSSKLLGFVLWHGIWSIMMNRSCPLEKNVYFAVVNGVTYKCHLGQVGCCVIIKSCCEIEFGIVMFCGELTPFSLYIVPLYPLYFLFLSLLFLISIASPAFFLLVFVCYICFHSFTYNPAINLYLKLVFCRQHIVGSYFDFYLIG